MIFKSENKTMVFCLSMQRSGTTSVGKFLADVGYNAAGWTQSLENNWSEQWYEGDFEAIFNSKTFLESNAFEDAPWFFPDFYKNLYHRFPNAKFLLLKRDSEEWFNSMVKHSNDNILGKTPVHCKIYRREKEYLELLHSNKLVDRENNYVLEKTMKLTPHKKLYLETYERHYNEVLEFFNRKSPNSLFFGCLDDKNIWSNMAEFLGKKIPNSYVSHENKSSL